MESFIEYVETEEQKTKREVQVAMMQKRMKAREAYLNNMKSRQKSGSGRVKSESDKFYDEFNDTIKKLQATLGAVTEETASPEFYQELKAEYAKLQEDMGEKGRMLPRFLLETSRRKLRAFRENIDESQKELAPTEKFRFSKRSRDATKKKKTAIIKPEAKEVHRFVADEITIENHNLETIYKEPGSINGKDVVLSNLKNCTISICDHLGAIRINDVSNCKIYIGPVASSLLVEKIVDSVVFIALRQCRIHSATETDFYLLANSDPIIEHSSGLRFAPYTFEYSELNSHFEASHLNKEVNLWNQVKDFNWLRQQQSPNWSIIPVAHRIKSISPVLPDDSEDEF